MSEACEFSFQEAPSPELQPRMTYAAQCPLCGAIRTSQRRAGDIRVFPWHRPLEGPPQNRACWKRDENGTWHWHWWTPEIKGESE